jgi:raffinose/stachyose/melibiose transport system substrate-binding protein
MIRKSRSLLTTLALLFLIIPLTLRSATAQDKVTLVFLTFESPSLTAQFWDNAINAALSKMPDGANITVQRIVSPNIDRTAYAKQLLASGQFPDLLQSINTQEFIDANLLQPWDTQWITDHFTIPMGNALGGKIWQAPTNAQIIPYVFYNKDIFAKVGVTPPTTWAEFVDVATKIKAAGYKPLLTCGAADSWCTSIILSGIISADVLGDTPDWVTQRYAGTVKFSDAAMTDAFTKFKSLVDQGLIDTGDLGVDYATTNQAFIAGDAAMYPMGSWFLQQAANNAQFDVGVFMMPRDDGNVIVPFNVGGGTHISAISEHPQEAMEFAEAFALEPSALSGLIESDSAFPLIKGMTLDDFHVTVSDLFKVGYSYTDMENTTKVDAFAWVNNDSALIAGLTDEFAKSTQNIILGNDVETETARLDTLWDEAAARSSSQ